VGLGIPGLYVLADPSAPDAQSKEGQILIPFKKLFEKVCCKFFEVRIIAGIFQKGLSLGTGQCNVKS
jgi:glutathione-independent formaldehyde dehydrogenase